MLIAEVDGVYWYRFVSEGCRIQRQLPFNLRRKTMLYEATLLPCLKLKSIKIAFPALSKQKSVTFLGIGRYASYLRICSFL